MPGRCLVTATKRGNLDIITVVLGSDTKRIRTQDSIKLIEYTYANFEHIDVGEKVREKFEHWKYNYSSGILVDKGAQENITAKMGEQKYAMFPINKGGERYLYIEIATVDYLEAPVSEGTVIRKIGIKNKR